MVDDYILFLVQPYMLSVAVRGGTPPYVMCGAVSAR